MRSRPNVYGIVPNSRRVTRICLTKFGQLWADTVVCFLRELDEVAAAEFEFDELFSGLLSSDFCEAARLRGCIAILEVGIFFFSNFSTVFFL